MRNYRSLGYRIYGSEIRIIGIIGHSLVRKEGKRLVRKELIRELTRIKSTVKLTDSEANKLWLFSQYCLNRIGNIGNKASNSDIYLKIKRIMPVLEPFKNGLVRDIEARDKNAYLSDLLSDGIFYLCSSHKDCAADHLEWQGKIYVSEDWEARCMDYDREKIAAYIKNHDVKTIEWVLGAPVYMTTRPNCRHYFKNISVDEVLHRGVKRLLRDYDMVQSANYRGDAYYIYREYYERVRFLESLRDVCPCYELEVDIRHARKLMYKWIKKMPTN